MKSLKVIVILLFCTALSYGQTAADSAAMRFKKALNDAGMTFTMPTSAVEIPIVKNMQMHYELAVTIPGKPIEIRYAIAPYVTLRNALKKYQKDGDTTEAFNKKMNEMSKVNTLVISTNVGGGVRDTTIKSRMFPPEAVKREFGADWGGTILIPIKNNSFGTEYKFCMMTVIHKDFAGDGYIMYLGNSLQEIGRIIAENIGINGGYYALKFKE